MIGIPQVPAAFHAGDRQLVSYSAAVLSLDVWLSACYAICIGPLDPVLNNLIKTAKPLRLM